jgi:hypothetical protein
LVDSAAVWGHDTSFGVSNRILEFILKPWHLIVLFLAPQINREQQRTIEYLHVENQVLREKKGRSSQVPVHPPSGTGLRKSLCVNKYEFSGTTG